MNAELKLDAERVRLVVEALTPGCGSSAMSLSDLNRRLGEYVGQRRAANMPPMVKALAEADAVLPASISTANANKLVATQSAMGCIDLGRLLSADQIRDIHEHLRTKTLLVGHTPETSSGRVSSLGEIPADKSFACYDYLDLWSAPHLIEHAVQERFLDVAQGYMGYVPTLYSINAFWSLPGRAPHPYTQEFHRDYDDCRSLVFFSQLTDVATPDEGAHFYAETSHEPALLAQTLCARGIEIDTSRFFDGWKVLAPLVAPLFRDTARRFMGPAGTSFCSDGYGLHYALVPRTKPRLLLWVRFGSFFNSVMFKMPEGRYDRAQSVLDRIPNTPRHRYVFRYMIDALDRCAGR